MVGLIGTLVHCNLKVSLLNVYAPNNLCERRAFLEHLSCVIDSLELPILLGSDFNTVKLSDERIGAYVSKSSMDNIFEFIQRKNLINLPMSRRLLIWDTGGSSSTASRLDRFLISSEFL
ncbi:hypothetical protein GQ457_10G012060 [Hibiscus cannabinus]